MTAVNHGWPEGQYLSIPIAASSVTVHCLMADAVQTRYNPLADRHKEAPDWYAFHCFSPFECNLLLICGEICSSPVRRTIHVPSYSLAMPIQPAYIGRGYDMEGKLLSFNRCLFSLSQTPLCFSRLLARHACTHKSLVALLCSTPSSALRLWTVLFKSRIIPTGSIILSRSAVGIPGCKHPPEDMPRSRRQRHWRRCAKHHQGLRAMWS